MYYIYFLFDTMSKSRKLQLEPQKLEPHGWPSSMALIFFSFPLLFIIVFIRIFCSLFLFLIVFHFNVYFMLFSALLETTSEGPGCNSDLIDSCQELTNLRYQKN